MPGSRLNTSVVLSAVVIVLFAGANGPEALAQGVAPPCRECLSIAERTIQDPALPPCRIAGEPTPVPITNRLGQRHVGRKFPLKRVGFDEEGWVVADHTDHVLHSFQIARAPREYTQDLVSDARLRELSLSFLRRRFAGLFATGEPPRLTDESSDISERGAIRQTWRSEQQGLVLPTRVELEISVYDGKIVGAEYYHEPVTAALSPILLRQDAIAKTKRAASEVSGVPRELEPLLCFLLLAR